MAYSRLLRLGSSNFPLGTSVATVERGRSIGSQKLARADGMRQTAGYRNGIRVVLRVPLVKGPMDATAHRSKVDSIRAILAQGPANLWLFSDRYYRCCESLSEPEEFVETGFDRIDQMSVTLIGPDMVMFDATDSTDTWSGVTSGASRTITAGGNTYAYPTLSITVGGSGLVTLAATITNNTTGESFTLSGAVTGGDVIVVKSLSQPSVKISGVDRLDLFDGLFVRLASGANSLTVSWTSGSITQIVTAWTDRWE